MKIKMAHLREQGIDFAVFDADATSRLDSDREELLGQLVAAARGQGLKIDKAALAFRQGSRNVFYGTSDLVKFLSGLGGVPRWTHTIDL